MARRKAPWTIKALRYLTSMVSWTCLPYGEGDGEWDRMVTVTFDLDGRMVTANLTPGEAKALGNRLITTANRVEASNAEHGNGGTYPTQSIWAER